MLTNEYFTPITVNQATLNKWLVDCMADCVEWEAEKLTEGKDGGSKVVQRRGDKIACLMTHTNGPGYS